MMSVSAPSQLNFEFGRGDGYAFAHFEPGANGLALRHLMDLLDKGHGQALVTGVEGTGKTHLLSAACAHQHQRGKSVVYIPLAELRTVSPSVLRDLGEHDLVAVDDLQSVVGDSAWERALFDVWICCESLGGVFVASRHRGGVAEVRLPDLASRLRASISIDLVPLDDDDLCRAMGRVAHRRGLELGTDVAQYLLRRVPRDMHSLVALVEALDHASLAQSKRPSVPFVRDWLVEHSARSD
ncbi:MAG: DnaA regulatory inactivator Hda [Chromatiales bacterium]|jgi:DnaA-homolog protein|nr:DnaA regulatory inactivator Hda [Chromatiales bacterium]